MTLDQFIQVLALVMLFLAAFVAWPRPQPWGNWHWSLGWIGMFLWLLAILLKGWIK